MILTEEPRYEFYPDVGDNLSLPETERLSVEIIRPTGYQRSDFTSIEVKREYYPDDQPTGPDGTERMVKKLKSEHVRMRFDADYILRTCVGYIRNLKVETGTGKGKSVREIKNGTELAECRAYGIEKIVSSICTEVQSDSITEAKKKITE